MSDRRLRILSYTTLFPSPARPMRGLFVARRLAQVARSEDLTVVAPVPVRFGAPPEVRVPERAADEFRVIHPRYWLPPRWGKRWHDRLLYLQTEPAIRSLNPKTFDLVDAQYAYPDGSAAGMIAARIGKPYVLTVRGSDLHVLANDPARRPAIRKVLRGAGAVVAVSKPLARLAEELGAEARRVHWIPNGVDQELFRPRPRSEARAALGWDPSRPAILFVGRLDPIKGLRLLLESVGELRRAELPTISCYLAGQGPMLGEIRRRVEAGGLGGNVTLLGGLPPERLALCYAAADLLCLPSVSEGSPNVVLESLASGTPVVSTDVGDVAELLDRSGGTVVQQRNPREFARAIFGVLSAAPDRAAIVARVAGHGWDRVAAAQIEVYRSVLGTA